jgi:hypothetical protein
MPPHYYQPKNVGSPDWRSFSKAGRGTIRHYVKRENYERFVCDRPVPLDGMWVFDDPQKGLTREPFVGGRGRSDRSYGRG